MNIKLNWLKVSNFKGLKGLTIMANGKNVSIFGNNATGKTSIIDSFLWLLFDKDSNDKSDTSFTIKPQDANGKDIMFLEPTVEVELLVDGQPLKVKKSKVEKWVKRQGATEKVFDGHTNKYWFDEVPCKAGEYKNKIDGLINENIFKMITNPLYFNTKLSWQERRTILLEISGDATAEQVIATDESLSNLTEILNGRSIDDYKLVIADQLKNYKKERDNLPPRIDELTRSLPQEEPNYEFIEIALSERKDDLARIEFLLTNATNKANKITEKYQELARLKNQLEEIKAKIKSELGAGKQELANKHSELFNGVIVLKGNIQALESQIEGYKNNINYSEQELIRLREEWTSLSNKKAEIVAQQLDKDSVTASCPVCKQSLPQDDIQNKITEMETEFNNNKTSLIYGVNGQLESNKQAGIFTKEKVVQAKKDKELAEKELTEKKLKLDLLRIELSATETVLNEPLPEPDYTKYPEMAELSTQINNLAYELDKPVEDKSTELLVRKADIQAKIDELNKVLNDKTEIERKKARIEELKADEKRVSALIAELEGHKFLLERFSTAKANLLEDSINSQFKHVKFKLFEENITNEGIKETCIALVNTNGAYVKFEDANSAGRINSGIDIINALTKFYGVLAPIFTDNAESVTDLADTESQVIKLIKPEIRNEEDRNKYSQLVVEVGK